MMTAAIIMPSLKVKESAKWESVKMALLLQEDTVAMDRAHYLVATVKEVVVRAMQ